VRHLPLGEQEVDRRGAGPAARLSRIAESFAKIAAFGVRLKAEQADDVFGALAHPAFSFLHSHFRRLAGLLAGAGTALLLLEIFRKSQGKITPQRGR
jgi:hypothetical protein